MTLRRQQSWFRSALVCGALIVPAIGCGDDDKGSESSGIEGDGGTSEGGKSGTAGKSGSGGSGAKGGAGGKSGAGGKGGAGGSSSGGGAVTCGGEACTPNSTLVMISSTAKACCTEDDQCGQTNSDGECKQQMAPGTKDEKCPTVHVDFMGMDYPQDGCCTPKGQCGGNFEQVGFGCLPREELLKDQGGPLEAISCGNGGEAGKGGAGGSEAAGSGGAGGAGGTSAGDTDAGADDSDAGN